MKVVKELLKTTKDKKNQKPEGKTDKRKVKESADTISSSDTADEDEDSQMEESE